MNFELGDLVTFIAYSDSMSDDNKYRNRLGVIIEIKDKKLYRYRVKWIDNDIINDEQFTYEASELKKL